MIELYCGDCLDILKNIPDDSVDLICADMPYGTTRCAWDSVIDLDSLWEQLKRVSKERAAIILFAQTPFDKILGVSNIKMLRYEWIWEKTNATGFLNAKKMPLKAHENILVFYKKLPAYSPQKTTGHKRKVSRRNSIGSDIYGECSKDVCYDSTDRYPRSVIKFKKDTQKSNLHPNQKPLSMLQYIVATYSDKCDVVMDFCMGSGTAGLASKLLGRSFIGIEKDKKYFDTAKDRIDNGC